jgi:hypothetical protein
MKKFNITIASLPDRENLVAEIVYSLLQKIFFIGENVPFPWEISFSSMQFIFLFDRISFSSTARIQ